MDWMKRTWKDEFVAFLIFILALMFARGQWAFFMSTQKERAVSLRHFEPRRDEPVEEPSVVHVPNMAYARSMVMLGTQTIGGMVIYQRDGSGFSQVYYKNE